LHGSAYRPTELLVSSTLALDEMTTEKVREIRPDLVVSDSVDFGRRYSAGFDQGAHGTFL